jgi:hypothetical protein
MGLANANKVYRKSGGSPTIAFFLDLEKVEFKGKSEGCPRSRF